MNYPAGAATDPRAPYNQTFNPGEEDLLNERVFLPEEDEWATVESGEQWDDAEYDDEGIARRYGGVTMLLRVDGVSTRLATMELGDLADLVREQYGSELHAYDPNENYPHWVQRSADGRFVVRNPAGERAASFTNRERADEFAAKVNDRRGIPPWRFWPQEYTCECGHGCYHVTDNDGWLPPSVASDEGRPMGQCPECDEDLTPTFVGAHPYGRARAYRKDTK